MSDNLFLRAEDRYTIKWAKNPRKLKVGEIAVPMPVMPHKSLIKNYDKKKKDQKYQKEIVPKGIDQWSPKDIEAFAEAQWHRRLNGEWQMINGEPYYIPGGCIPFFDFGTLESGKKAEFRYSALTLFWVWYLFVERNDNCFGLANFKTRRIGDTANFLHILKERTTRYKGVRGGLQSHKDDIAQKTFARLAKAVREDPFFFRPNRSGSDKEFIAWMAPNEVNTMKKLKEKKTQQLVEEFEVKEFLGSYIDYEATFTGAYDGEQLFTYFMDEIFKIAPYRMDAIKQWKNIRRCLSLFGEQFIYGKGILSSTVEKKSSTDESAVSTVDIGQKIWDESDPAEMLTSEDGRTTSGLVRLFRGYELAGVPDEYGFPQTEKARKFRRAKINKALKTGNLPDLYDIYRKEPATIEEALIEDNIECPLYPEICQVALKNLNDGLDKHGNKIDNYRQPWVEGELVWANNIPNSKVVFMPRAGGPWHISQLPDQANHVRPQNVLINDETGQKKMVTTFIPMNAPHFRVAADPISSNPAIIGKGSQGAITVKRRWNPHMESPNLEFDPVSGLVTNPEIMVTNQVVADYLFRPMSPNLYFEEIIKACYFWGCPALIEMDKIEAYVYMRNKSYFGFIMNEPYEISIKRNRKKRPAPGIRSSGDIVGSYVTALQIYIANYWPVIKHPRLLRQAGRFVTRKRTKFDAVVSWGLVELADRDNRYREPEKNAVDKWATTADPFAR